MKNISLMSAYPSLRPQAGLTLIELMISLVISLVLVLFIGTLFINSKTSFRLNDDNARLHEDANYALSLIGRNLMQAGFDDILASSTPITGPGLMGCDNGFTSPLAATPVFTCGTAGSAAFQVRYRVDPTVDADSGAGVDCNGQGASGIATNRFFVGKKASETATSLYCNGSGNAAVSQPILANVETMALTYGVAVGDTFFPSQYQSATAAGIDDPASSLPYWKKVISVQVCLLVKSENNVTDGNRSYTDCTGAAQTAADNKLRRAFTKVFTLRNNAQPSLL